jgi:putative ABC transport system permease protein
MNTFMQDLRYALRMLRKNPGFTAAAVLTLALGIGANTAIFAVINGVLLRPLPYKDPGKLVIFWNDYGSAGQSLPAVSAPDYKDYLQRDRLFDELAAAAGGRGSTVDAGDSAGQERPEKIDVGSVSANFFPTLGVYPILGRQFTTDEAILNGPKVAMLSFRLWQRRYGSDPGIVGKTIQLNKQPLTIVGVMPADFKLLLPPEALLLKDEDLWRPLQLNYDASPRNLTNLTVLGRLKKDVNLAQAQSEMDGIAAQLRNENEVHRTSGMTIRLVPYQYDIVKNVKFSLIMLMGAVGLVLLIACGNVANLMLARASSRRKEIAIRTALGAGRSRVIRQVLTESILLAFFGGALGLLFALWGTDLLLFLRPANLPRLQEVHIDSKVLLFCLAACVATGILFGMAQALPAIRWKVGEFLNEGSKGAGGSSRNPARKILIISEIALSLMLLLGAGLLIRSFFLLERVRPGFDASNVLTFQLQVPLIQYPTYPDASRFYQQVEDKIAALPGVQSVGGITQAPLTGSGPQTPYAYNAETEQKWESISADWRSATPGYFQTMGMRLKAGRFFSRTDDLQHPYVVIVDETLARQAWPNEDPIGKRLQVLWFSSLSSPNLEKIYAQVVGVIEHPRIHDLSQVTRPQIYMSHSQLAFPNMTIVVRSTGDLAGLGKQIEDQIHMLDRGLAVSAIRPMNYYVSDVMAPRRFSFTLTLIFGAIALMLAAIGLYGVIAYSVSQRTREIGIRMALGAGPKDVLHLIISQGVSLVLPGILLGLVGGFALTRLLSGLLYGVSAADLPTYAIAALIVAFVSIAACLIPALRASRLHPMVALRYE